MRKVYVLYNWDTNDIIAISEDRGLIEEIMCDCFMADVEYQWFWEQQYHTLEIAEANEYAKDLWNDMVEWYEDNIGIYEEDLI